MRHYRMRNPHDSFRTCEWRTPGLRSGATPPDDRVRFSTDVEERQYALAAWKRFLILNEFPPRSVEASLIGSLAFS
jgi:hypothetical protein